MCDHNYFKLMTVNVMLYPPVCHFRCTKFFYMVFCIYILANCSSFLKEVTSNFKNLLVFKLSYDQTQISLFSFNQLLLLHKTHFGVPKIFSLIWFLYLPFRVKYIYAVRDFLFGLNSLKKAVKWQK